jgi:hypothetical protein
MNPLIRLRQAKLTDTMGLVLVFLRQNPGSRQVDFTSWVNSECPERKMLPTQTSALFGILEDRKYLIASWASERRIGSSGYKQYVLSPTGHDTAKHLYHEC